MEVPIPRYTIDDTIYRPFIRVLTRPCEFCNGGQIKLKNYNFYCPACNGLGTAGYTKDMLEPEMMVIKSITIEYGQGGPKIHYSNGLGSPPWPEIDADTYEDCLQKCYKANADAI